MPRALEFRQIDGEVWVRFELTEQTSPIYMYTWEEVKAVKRRAVLDFARSLADRYIMENEPYAQS